MNQDVVFYVVNALIKNFLCALVKQFAYDEKRGFEQSKPPFSFSKLDLRGCLRHFVFSG